MIAGIFGGLLVGLLLLGLFAFFASESYNDTSEIILLVIGIILFILSIIFFSTFGKQKDIYDYKQTINTYVVNKETIEDSICNEKLAGLEKIQLVEQATKLNADLEKVKIDVQKWWHWYLDDNMVKDLMPVDLSVCN